MLSSLKGLESEKAELPAKDPTMKLFSLSIKKIDNEKVFRVLVNICHALIRYVRNMKIFSGEVSGKKCLKIGISTVSYCITLSLDI